MNIDTSIADALLTEYDNRPSGYKVGDTITYGTLAPEFLYQMLNRPDAKDTQKYSLGAADLGFQIDMGKWTKAYGQDQSFADASAAQWSWCEKL